MSKQNFVSFNCTEPLHTFARSGEDIGAFHADNSECKGAEFNLTDLLNDELPEMMICPTCDHNTLDGDHIRKCMGYRPSPTATEVLGCYSDPTERAKRESLLASIEA
jgi:hypothetical protein